jgi:hypothetical protein
MTQRSALANLVPKGTKLSKRKPLVIQDFVEMPATMDSGSVVLSMHSRKFHQRVHGLAQGTCIMLQSFKCKLHAHIENKKRTNPVKKKKRCIDTSSTNPFDWVCYAVMAWEHGSIPSYASSRYVLSYPCYQHTMVQPKKYQKSLKPVDQLDPRRSIGFNWFQVSSPRVPNSCSILKSITQFPLFLPLPRHSF